MSTPAVSIILPTYNRLEYLKEAVASVRMQTFSDWELIVVDDGSTDASIEWLKSIGDARVSVIPRSHTANKALLRNTALAHARADWIAFIDSDDRWPREKLARHLAYHAENPALRWSYTDATMIDASGVRLAGARFTPWVPHSGWILDQVLSLDANIALPSVMVRTALLREAGGFNDAWLWAEDFELWVRLAERAECGLLNEPLLEIRKHRAVRYQSPHVSLGFAAIYESFAARTPDRALRRQSLTRAAYHAVNAADRFAMLRQWKEARAALKIALRIRPFAPFGYRAVARFAGRRIAALVKRSSALAA